MGPELLYEALLGLGALPDYKPVLSQQLGPAAGGESVAGALTALYPSSIPSKKEPTGFSPGWTLCAE